MSVPFVFGNARFLIFPCKASSLQFLDISRNVLEKKSVEYLVASFKAAQDTTHMKSIAVVNVKKPAVLSLRLDECSLRPGALEVLGKVLVFELI